MRIYNEAEKIELGDEEWPHDHRKGWKTFKDDYARNAMLVKDCMAQYPRCVMYSDFDDDARFNACFLVTNMTTFLGSDRLPIGDMYAVMPNYYITRYYNEPAYHIGLMVVLRDYRDIMANLDPRMFLEAKERFKSYIVEKGTTREAPCAGARLYDVPIGYLTDIEVGDHQTAFYLNANREDRHAFMLPYGKLDVGNHTLDVGSAHGLKPKRKKRRKSKGRSKGPMSTNFMKRYWTGEIDIDGKKIEEDEEDEI